MTSRSPNIRLSCGDHSFPLLPHELVVDLIAGLGFDGLNLIIWGNRSSVRPDEIRADVSGWAGRLAERVRSRGLEFADIVAIPWTDYESLALNHPDPEERERSFAFFADMLELTVRLGAPTLTMLPGVDWPGESHEESLERCSRELKPRIAAAKDCGVGYSIEPHLGSVCQSLADVERLCGALPDLTLTLDYTHFVVQGFAEEDIDSLLPRTRHLHVRGGNRERIQASNAVNTIDNPRILRQLASLGYDGYVAIEYVWNDWEGMNDIDVLSETVILRDQLRELLTSC
jgi:sugar phosphate isomerase/epimerase